MTPDEYREAADLFDRLRDVCESEQTKALDFACYGQPELHRQVIEMLKADRDAIGTDFLAGAALGDAALLIKSDTAELPCPGMQMGNYRLGTRIGSGGMGVVFEGHDLRLNRRVAIKILPSHRAQEGSEQVRRFQREARAASLLNHPNIVSIFDADRDRGFYFIATEFIEGQTLRQSLNASPKGLDAQIVSDVLAQTASALRAAHEAGIVHRDIKPENIMLRPDGFVKVLDFGLAKLLEPSRGDSHEVSELRTRPGHLAGTIQYLSPEQVAGKPVDARSDLFSLGVVAYELVTGTRAFDGPTDGAVFSAILNRQPLPPSALRPAAGTALDGLIMRSLEKDPELRFQTAGDLRSSCQRITRDNMAHAIDNDRDAARDATRKESSTKESAEFTALRVRRFRPRRRWLFEAVTLPILAAFALWRFRPDGPLRVTRVVRLTSDGQTKQWFVNDGIRLYYTTGLRDSEMKLFQVSLKGGDSLPMPRLTGMLPLDISPDRSEILLGQILSGPANRTSINGPFPIWVADTLGNPPRPLEGLMAGEARWSPAGDRILYTVGAELRICRIDGSQSRNVLTFRSNVLYPVWSPGGKSIRFTGSNGKMFTLWEVNSDGTHLHEVLPDWADRLPAYGSWSSDGINFIFTAGPRGSRDLWALPRNAVPLDLIVAAPVRLTTGPMKADLPASVAGARRILFMGSLSNGELVRYEAKTDLWMPYLGGVPAAQIDFSRDGKSIAYLRCTDGAVWRSSLDGSHPVQLTAAISALNPRWSPDESRIAFSGHRTGEHGEVFLVPAAGGDILRLTDERDGSLTNEDPGWMPDGDSLVIGSKFGGSPGDDQHRLVLRMIDVGTRNIRRLAGSEGLWSPRVSPDGRYIAAMGFPNRLWLYSVQTGERIQLTTIGAGWPSWSRDGRYVYFDSNATSAWYRVRIADRKVEWVANLSRVKMVPVGLGWAGLAPDGALIATRDTGSSEIYALDWDK